MSSQLFDHVDYKNDPHWVAKEFFNSIYQQESFLWALPLLVERKGCGVNEEVCVFPDLDDPDPSFHFSGVMFVTFGDEVVISDDEFLRYLRVACTRYLQNHPERRVEVDEILGRPGNIL
jgi:hypothetical protein